MFFLTLLGLGFGHLLAYFVHLGLLLHLEKKLGPLRFWVNEQGTSILIVKLHQFVEGRLDLDEIFLCFSDGRLLVEIVTFLTSLGSNGIRMVLLGQLQVLALEHGDVNRLGGLFGADLERIEALEHLFLHDTRHLSEGALRLLILLLLLLL